MVIISNARNTYTNADRKYNDGLMSFMILPVILLVFISYLTGELVLDLVSFSVFIFIFIALMYNIINFVYLDYKTERETEINAIELNNRMILNTALSSNVDIYGNYR